jgi:hypothetical protein
METTGSIAEHVAPPGAEADEGLGRLAELVEHLTDCRPQLAVAAVRQAAERRPGETAEDRLLLVARAMLSVRDGVDLRE